MHILRIGLVCIIIASIWYSALDPASCVCPIVKCTLCGIYHIIHSTNLKWLNIKSSIITTYKFEHLADGGVHWLILSLWSFCMIISPPIPSYLISSIMQVDSKINFVLTKYLINNASRGTLITFAIPVDRKISIYIKTIRIGVSLF